MNLFKFKRNVSVQVMPIGEDVRQYEYKIENAEDAETLYQMGIEHKENQINNISKYVIGQYANSLAEGKSSFSYRVNPRNSSGHICIPIELRDDLAINIGSVLGEKFEVTYYRSGHPAVYNAIEIKRKEED